MVLRLLVARKQEFLVSFGVIFAGPRTEQRDGQILLRNLVIFIVGFGRKITPNDAKMKILSSECQILSAKKRHFLQYLY